MENNKEIADTDPSKSPEYIRLLREIKSRDELIKDIKTKILEKDTLIEQLTKVLGQKGKIVKMASTKNNIIYYNLTNLISHFDFSLEGNNNPIVNKTFNFAIDNRNQFSLISNVNTIEELSKSKSVIEQLNKEKLRLTSKINSNKLKMKQVMKMVNEKFSLYTRKNNLLSQSITQITNNISKAEKEKYDLESVIFQQEDKISQLTNQLNTLLESSEQKDAIITKHKILISELNGKLNSYKQINGTLMQKSKNDSLILNKNYSYKNLRIPKIPNNSSLVSKRNSMKNIGNISLNYSNNKGNTDRGMKRLFDRSVLDEDSENQRILLESKINKVIEQKQTQKVNEVRSMLDNLVNDLSN